MTKINCWNEYDSLKTVILGSIFENDRIPETFTGKDQENFVKIVEETNIELKNYQIILEQFGVTVLRPTQPKNYNGLELPYHEPLINMRDFHMAYGNIFFMSYGHYKERRFQHLWLEDIVNKFIMDGNLVVNANEINIDGGIPVDYNNVLLGTRVEEYYKIKKINHTIPNKYKEQFINLIKKKNTKQYLESEGKDIFEWYIEHNYQYNNKNLFHAASLLKFNKQCFLSTFNGNDIGNKWLENWLTVLGVKPIYIPYVGHLDSSYSILNENTLLVSTKEPTNKKITSCFKNIIEIDFDYTSRHVRLLAPPTPTEWLEKWRDYFKEWPDCNSLVINPQNLLLNFYDKNLYLKLKNVGINVEYVKWSNSTFWEGGLHCITCDIERRPE